MFVNTVLAACLVLVLLTTFASGGGKGVMGTIHEKGGRVLAAVATPVEKAIVSKAFRNCEGLKKKMGVSSNDMDDLTEDDISNIKLDLISGSEKSVFKISTDGSDLLNDKLFDKSKPIAIFIHGFMSSSGASAAQEVTNALAQRGEHNVLALDAGAVIKNLYLRSSTYVRFIGEHLGRAVAALIRQKGVDPKHVHLVGHSLGAHISGFAGKTVELLTGQKVGRISGLDPAGPCFFEKEPELRLRASDADFVDVIHTDKGVLGITEPIGHVDFYPNDGDAQPGCVVPPCSHSRAWQLFSESVLRPTAFPGLRCSGWRAFAAGDCEGSDQEVMGFGASVAARGTYFLKTAGAAPYGMGYQGVAKAICNGGRNIISWFKGGEQRKGDDLDDLPRS